MKIELSNLSTGYLTPKGLVTVQRDINTHLVPGEFVALLGSNGVGKTTLLRTISGLQPTLGGSIEIDGINLNLYSDIELAKRIGVVLTERPSVSAMTVTQLVALGRSPYTGFWGRLSNHDNKIIEDSLRKTNTGILSHRLFDTLSDGERQRVMIAKALAQESEAILLDEPTAFLDFPTKIEMMKMLRTLAHEEGKIIMLSTHDVNMALTLADKIWLMSKEGGIVAGSATELSEKGYLSKFFTGSGMKFNAETLQYEIV